MIAWIQANPLLALTVWGGINAGLLSPLAKAIPPTSWYGKILHTLVALSPVDAVKAMKVIGTELTPPTGTP